MINLATIGKVLRMHRCEKKPSQEDVNVRCLSRNTLRKYLRLDKDDTPKYPRADVHRAGVDQAPIEGSS